MVFGGLLPPNHPLWSKFDDKTLSIADYKKLKATYGEEMRKEAAKLLVAVRKGERVPIRTRIFLFDDSVTVDDFVMNKTQQYVTLRTTRKHTFRNGVSRHQFFTLPGFSNQLLFVNCGEGESEVPFFGPINNRVASPAIQLAQEHIVLFDRSEKATKRVGEDLFAFRCVQELLQKALEAK